MSVGEGCEGGYTGGRPLAVGVDHGRCTIGEPAEGDTVGDEGAAGAAGEARGAAHEELRRSEARYRALIEAGGSFVWVAGQDGRSPEALAWMREFTGLTPEHADPPEFWLAAVHPDDRACVASTTGVAREARVPYELEFRLRHATGEYHHVQLRGVPVADGGALREWVGSLTDVTDRRRAGQALRDSEERLRDAHARLRSHVENTPLALVEWDGEYRVRGYSKRAEEVFGFAPEEVLGKRLDAIPWVPEGDLPTVQATMRDLWTAGRQANVSANRNLRKDGSAIDCEWYNSALYDAEGRLGSILSLVLDVTDRKKAERERDRLAQQRQLAIDAASLGWLSWDERTGETTHDRRFAEIFGLTGPVRRPREELRALIHPDDLDRVGAALDAALDPADPRSYAAEYRVIRPDGTIRWVESHGLATFEGEGEARRIASFVGTVADVTARKETERALQDSDRRKNEFLAVLSHELRNPLAPIRNGLYLLDHAEPGSEPDQRARAVLHRQVEHLTRLVDDLLDVARVSRGKIDLRRARIDAGEVVARTCDDHRADYEQRGIALRCGTPPEPAWVDADPARLAQMVGNLLHNALKFTPPGGTVDALVERHGVSCEITVRDTGDGIDPDDLPRIFFPFAQADRTRARSHGGLGIGLSLVRELAVLHGGSASASSRGVGQGAEFVIELPLAPAPEQPGRRARSAGEGGLSVLVVEDNADAGATLADLLGMLGHAARVAGTGKEAIAEASHSPPDVLVCDIGLPDLSGYDVIRALRSSPAGARTFAVALTGYAQPQDRDEAFLAGFDGHLAKPPDVDELLSLLDQARRRREQASGAGGRA